MLNKTYLKDIPFDSIEIGIKVLNNDGKSAGSVLFKKKVVVYSASEIKSIGSIVIDIDKWFPLSKRHDYMDDWYLA